MRARRCVACRAHERSTPPAPRSRSSRWRSRPAPPRPTSSSRSATSTSRSSAASAPTAATARCATRSRHGAGRRRARAAAVASATSTGRRSASRPSSARAAATARASSGPRLRSKRWTTERGLHVGDPTAKLKQLYPGAEFTVGAFWLYKAYDAFVQGDAPIVTAQMKGGAVNFIRVRREPARSDERRAGDSTRAAHAGLPARADGEPFLPGPTFAAPYHLAGPADASRFNYGRYDNPTWARLEEALGELEGAQSVVFAAGMAAVSAVVIPGAAHRRRARRAVGRLPGHPRHRPRRARAQRRRGAARAHRRRRRARGAAGRDARVARVALQPGARRARPAARCSPRPTPAARSWPSTTRSPARCASARSSSAPTTR